VGARVRILFCLAVGVLALSAPGIALAQGGTTTSAGDQQYVDPLATTTTSATTPTHPTSTTTATAPSASSSPTATPTTTTASPALTTSSTPAASANTLPFTGLNLGVLVAVGLGLIGGGALLLRFARRA
jgi:uncharacterized surface anchored protein